MKKTSLLKRGFKTKAEKLSISFRENLKLNPWDPICAFKLAKYLKIDVYEATELISDENEIEVLKKSEWSAFTLITEKGNRIIVHNPFHSTQRQQSNIMHELAHVICDHKREKEKYDFKIPFGMHEYDEVQEEEAIFLGAALQLSKACLFWSNKRNLTNDQIAEKFNSSVEMVKYRLNITGISKLRNFIKK